MYNNKKEFLDRKIIKKDFLGKEILFLLRIMSLSNRFDKFHERENATYDDGVHSRKNGGYKKFSYQQR